MFLHLHEESASPTEAERFLACETAHGGLTGLTVWWAQTPGLPASLARVLSGLWQLQAVGMALASIMDVSALMGAVTDGLAALHAGDLAAASSMLAVASAHADVLVSSLPANV